MCYQYLKMIMLKDCIQVTMSNCDCKCSKCNTKTVQDRRKSGRMEDWTFTLRVSDIKLFNVTQRCDQARVKVSFDHEGLTKKLPDGKTEWEDVQRNRYYSQNDGYRLHGSWSDVLCIQNNRSEVEGVIHWLKTHFIYLNLELKTSGTKNVQRVQLKLSYFDCATGTVSHLLPVCYENGKRAATMHVNIAFTEVSEISVHFHKIQFRDLKPLNHNKVQNLHPYLKYQFSKNWPAVKEGRIKAVHSEIRHRSLAPEWTDLPVLSFRTSLTQLLRHKIIVHVMHHGKTRNRQVATANLIFSTLIRKGRRFTDNTKIGFSGSLHDNDGKTHISGSLHLTGLPHFAQVVKMNNSNVPIRTEEGLEHAKPLISSVMLPEIPFVHYEPELKKDSSEDSSDPSSGSCSAESSEESSDSSDTCSSIEHKLVTFTDFTPAGPDPDLCKHKDAMIENVAQQTGINELLPTNPFWACYKF